MISLSLKEIVSCIILGHCDPLPLFMCFCFNFVVLYVRSTLMLLHWHIYLYSPLISQIFFFSLHFSNNDHISHYLLSLIGRMCMHVESICRSFIEHWICLALLIFPLELHSLGGSRIITNYFSRMKTVILFVNIFIILMKI